MLINLIKKYDGFIKYNETDKEWKVYIKNKKYMIIGVGIDVKNNDVVKSGTLTTTLSDAWIMCKRTTTLYIQTCNQSSRHFIDDGYTSSTTFNF